MFKHYCRLYSKSDLKFISKNITTTSTLNEKWDLITAVCVERRPVIAPSLTKLESEYKNLLSKVEFERSLKSDYEVRHEKELKQIEKLKKGEDVEVHLKETAQDAIDAWTEELSQFKFASKITEADKNNDVTSLNRKLDRHLVLVVKQKIGKDNLYLLPQSIRKDGETLRQTADRVLKETCGSELKAMIYGNAPFAFYKYKYPKEVREKDKCVGAKVFIYFARYLKGQLGDKKIDHRWLDRNELEKILPSEYKNSVSQMLIDE